jgi:tryptophan synthase alpha chain
MSFRSVLALKPRFASDPFALGANLLHSAMVAETVNQTRIGRRFAKLRDSGEMGIVAYITAGDPSFAATLKFVIAMADAGVDVIELGVPFSDPLADGPTIQRASERALKNGATLAGVIQLVRDIRSAKSPAGEVPIVLFSYYNPIFQMGLEKFAMTAAAAGADGVLVTDITPEESDEYRRLLKRHRLDTVFLAAPTSTDDRIEKIAKCSSGFLYLVSRTGVTGAKDALPDELPALLRRARHATKLPIAVGFGISLPGHVSVLGGLADAAVVGSALVSEIEKATLSDTSEAGIDSAAAALAERIRSLKAAARTGLSRREVAQ